MLNFILGGAGTGKSENMLSRIYAAVNAGKSCIVIVPDQFSFEYDKKLYAKLGITGYNRLTVFSFQRIAKNIFINYGGKKGSYAENSAKLALTYLAVRHVRDNDGLAFYERQSASGGFIGAVSDAMKELHWAGVSSEELADKSALVGGELADKTTDISNIYSEYLRLLSERGLKDSLCDISDAAEIAARNNCFDGKNIFIDEFQSFSGDELLLIDAMISTAENVTVSLATEDVSARQSLFNIVNRTYFSLCSMAEKHCIKVGNTVLSDCVRFSSDDLKLVSESVFRNHRKAPIHSNNVRIIEANDVYNEAEYVCAQIKKLVRSGLKYSEIAVVTRNLYENSSMLEGTLERYDIPYFLDMNKPVRHKSVMLFVTAALEYAVHRKPRTESILRYAKTGLTGVDYEDISELDNYVYRWGIDGDMWLEDFRYDESDKLNGIRRMLIEPLENFRRKTHDASGKEICSALYELFSESGAETAVTDVRSLDVEKLAIIREQKQLWNMLIENLDELYAVFGDEKIKLSEFAELFLLIASSETVSAPPQTLDAVTVSEISRARLAAPKAVFVMGVCDGNFPYAAKSSGLFDDKDRAALLKGGITLEMNTEYRLDEERFICYKALSSASEYLYITYPLANSAGEPCYPSYVIGKVSGLFENDITISAGKLGALFFAETKRAAYYSYVQEYNSQNSDFAALREYLLKDDEYAPRIEFLDKIKLNEKEKIDNKVIAKKLFGDNLCISPSRFEDFEKCPFMYFCKKGLSLYPIKKVELDYAEIGSVIHQCLCDVIGGLSRDDFLSADDEKIRKLIKTSFDGYYSGKLGGDFGKNARFSSVYENSMSTAFDILAHIRNELSQSEFYPSDFELEISSGGNVKPHKIATAGGEVISFVGMVDRVDTYEKNGTKYIRVVDYKTGEKKFKLEDVYYGINMQMLMYLFTLTDKQSGKYENAVPAGVLYMPAKEADAELDRNAGEDEADKVRDSIYKMNGIVLDSSDVILAMEKEAAGVYIPVAMTQKGEYSARSSLINLSQLERLKEYADRLVKNMAEKLYHGEIEAIPLVHHNIKPCSYCDYWSICGKSDSINVREYAKDAGHKMENILNGSDENA